MWLFSETFYADDKILLQSILTYCKVHFFPKCSSFFISASFCFLSNHLSPHFSLLFYHLLNSYLSPFLPFFSWRYEFGLVSHSFVAAVKVLLREFDILVAQLEHLLSSNRLSLQKMVSGVLLCWQDIWVNVELSLWCDGMGWDLIIFEEIAWISLKAPTPM